MNYALRAANGVKSGLVAITPLQKSFEKRIPVQFTRGHFTVKTVENRRELWQVYKLRYEVFHREYKNRRFPFGIDKDRYDQWADHLAIVDNRIGKVVGTYRLIRENPAGEFYSASEFRIEQVLDLPGTKVELSRACIHKSYRNGTVIALLWRGICEYVTAAGARWLFGMGSVQTTNPDEVAAVFSQLRSEGFVDETMRVPTVGKYRIPQFAERVAASVAGEYSFEVPALVRSYLKAGAIIGSDVAIDLDFNCADLFVVLDMTCVSASFSRKFQVH